MTEPDADACRPVEIDGEIIRVRGSSDMSDESRAALAEVIRAAKRKFAAEYPARLTVDTITSDQLDALYERIDRLREQVHKEREQMRASFREQDAENARLRAALARVRALRTDWLSTGAPPLGTSIARWWDKRLIELDAALDEPKEPTT